MIIKINFIQIKNTFLLLLCTNQLQAMDLFNRYCLIPNKQERRELERFSVKSEVIELIQSHGSKSLYELVFAYHDAKKIAVYRELNKDSYVVSKDGLTPLHSLALKRNAHEKNQAAKFKQLIAMGISLNDQIMEGSLRGLTCAAIIMGNMEINANEDYGDLCSLLRQESTKRDAAIEQIFCDTTKLPLVMIKIVNSYNEFYDPTKTEILRAVVQLRLYYQKRRDENEAIEAIRFRQPLPNVRLRI